ncbi:MAG: glycosyltransferase [Providencia heimbachae]|nr:glycosyltransferase [Providencia heimbachae]
MNKKIISICVISYNSQNTIQETLDSILNQDYGSENIELIIGDDASKDNTKTIIQHWHSKYKNKFHDVKLNLSKLNQGIVGNYNSTCQLATSKWIKLIAADDILMENCLTEFNSFVENNNNIECVFCKVEMFNHTSSLGIIPKRSYYFNLPAKKQFRILLIDNFFPAPGSFIRKSLLEKLNYADDGMSMEDYPMWLKLTSLGIQLPLLDKTLVRYRIGNSTSKNEKKLINSKLNNDTYSIKKNYLSKLESGYVIKFLYKFDLFISKKTD